MVGVGLVAGERSPSVRQWAADESRRRVACGILAGFSSQRDAEPKAVGNLVWRARYHMIGREAMAAALIDRLLHRCHLVNNRGNSYRMREH